MSATLTLTGKAGPGNTLTAAVFTNVTEFTVETENGTIRFNDANGLFRTVDISAATTVTATKTGTTWTLTIS